MQGFERITFSPDRMGGRACIRSMRITVGTVVAQIGSGQTIDDVLTAYPDLEREDVLQALRYAAWQSSDLPLPRPV